MAGPAETFQFAKGLGFRLAALLSVAILPIGLMSLIQTLYLSGEAERSAETAIVGRTGAAAAENARCFKARSAPPMRLVRRFCAISAIPRSARRC